MKLCALGVLMANLSQSPICHPPYAAAYGLCRKRLGRLRHHTVVLTMARQLSNLNHSDDANASPSALQSRSTCRFDGIRSAHRAERTEDYCEAVAELSRRTGEARVRDLSAMMGVSHVTVSRMITRLTSLGLVAQRQGRPVVLTDSGRKLAADSESRHAVVLNFLLALGVPRESAEADAEGIEHHVSRHSIDAMLRHTRALNEPIGSRSKLVPVPGRPGPEPTAGAKTAKPARKVRR